MTPRAATAALEGLLAIETGLIVAGGARHGAIRSASSAIRRGDLREVPVDGIRLHARCAESPEN